MSDSEHVNLFCAPLSVSEQFELSDLLDDVVQMYENGFCDQVSNDDDRDELLYEFKRLVEFVDEWSVRAMQVMYDKEAGESESTGQFE